MRSLRQTSSLSSLDLQSFYSDCKYFFKVTASTSRISLDGSSSMPLLLSQDSTTTYFTLKPSANIPLLTQSPFSNSLFIFHLILICLHRKPSSNFSNSQTRAKKSQTMRFSSSSSSLPLVSAATISLLSSSVRAGAAPGEYQVVQQNSLASAMSEYRSVLQWHCRVGSEGGHGRTRHLSVAGHFYAGKENVMTEFLQSRSLVVDEASESNKAVRAKTDTDAPLLHRPSTSQ